VIPLNDNPASWTGLVVLDKDFAAAYQQIPIARHDIIRHDFTRGGLKYTIQADMSDLDTRDCDTPENLEAEYSGAFEANNPQPHRSCAVCSTLSEPESAAAITDYFGKSSEDSNTKDFYIWTNWDAWMNGIKLGRERFYCNALGQSSLLARGICREARAGAPSDALSGCQSNSRTTRQPNTVHRWVSHFSIFNLCFQYVYRKSCSSV
jgi:hypothetical protein